MNKTYEVSGTIRIKDGHKSHGLKFEKRDMECDGPVDTPQFYMQILKDFSAEVLDEAEQVTLDHVSDKTKTDLKTGSKEAKDAAKKVNEAKK